MGKHLKFRTVEDLQKKIDEYFEDGHHKTKMRVGNVKEGYEIVEIPCLTITDLALYLGFCSRQSFYDYEKIEEYSYTIKKARLFIEREYEEQLKTGNPTGAIFALKNFGWTDKREVENKGEMTLNIIKKIVDGKDD